mmetsp:Transcript_852/g.991  ORF Transcript_852/g.991 Transcript_852/m.991 type:complete len:83 (+) Transcript_852:288-536(+)
MNDGPFLVFRSLGTAAFCDSSTEMPAEFAKLPQAPPTRDAHDLRKEGNKISKENSCEGSPRCPVETEVVKRHNTSSHVGCGA